MSAAARSDDDTPPTAPRPPRPPPWSPEQLRQISGYVTAGLSIPVACEAAGVKWTCAKEWLHKGRRGQDPYVPFVDAMRQAKAMHEAACRIAVSKHMSSDWRAAAWSWEKLEAQRQLERMRGRDPETSPDAPALPTVIRYPVPMPVGAEPDQTLVPRLPEDHAIHRAARSASAHEEQDDGLDDDDNDDE